MKTIKLNIDDSLYKHIKTVMNIKAMCGHFCGEIDEFLFLLIKNIEDNQEEITIERSKDTK
ncbi:hypothetical protein LCGC14_2166800 [marine sediment metagenome]|uniref:Uncharacterized protein n=1 Tax=marine sediment metagenome TaxID=412755 RepID=A0A0F9G405_9ZZZZ